MIRYLALMDDVTDSTDERYSVLDVLDTVVETTTNVFEGSLHNRVVSATDEALTRFIRANLRRGVANTDRWYGRGND